MNIREKIYGCRSYSELKMTLELCGWNCISRYIFDIVHPDDWKWETFVAFMEDIADSEMTCAQLDNMVEHMIAR